MEEYISYVTFNARQLMYLRRLIKQAGEAKFDGEEMWIIKVDPGADTRLIRFLKDLISHIQPT